MKGDTNIKKIKPTPAFFPNNPSTGLTFDVSNATEWP